MLRFTNFSILIQMGRVKRIWYLSPMRAAKVQASLRIRAVSPEPPLLAHIGSESSRTFRQKARSLAPLNGWACAVKICHDGMLEDTNSLDASQIIFENVKMLLLYNEGLCDLQLSTSVEMIPYCLWLIGTVIPDGHSFIFWICCSSQTMLRMHEGGVTQTCRWKM